MKSKNALVGFCDRVRYKYDKKVTINDCNHGHVLKNYYTYIIIKIMHIYK
jgi:hypothetical protein